MTPDRFPTLAHTVEWSWTSPFSDLHMSITISNIFSGESPIVTLTPNSILSQVRRGDVLAAWSGIRPLVRDPSAANSAALSRNHVIEISKSGLVTIAGGKWTTYRKMAEVSYKLRIHD